MSGFWRDLELRQNFKVRNLIYSGRYERSDMQSSEGNEFYGALSDDLCRALRESRLLASPEWAKFSALNVSGTERRLSSWGSQESQAHGGTFGTNSRNWFHSKKLDQRWLGQNLSDKRIRLIQIQILILKFRNESFQVIKWLRWLENGRSNAKVAFITHLTLVVACRTRKGRVLEPNFNKAKKLIFYDNAYLRRLIVHV